MAVLVGETGGMWGRSEAEAERKTTFWGPRNRKREYTQIFTQPQNRVCLGWGLCVCVWGGGGGGGGGWGGGGEV